MFWYIHKLKGTNENAWTQFFLSMMTCWSSEDLHQIRKGGEYLYPEGLRETMVILLSQAQSYIPSHFLHSGVKLMSTICLIWYPSMNARCPYPQSTGDGLDVQHTILHRCDLEKNLGLSAWAALLYFCSQQAQTLFKNVVTLYKMWIKT